MLDPCTFVIFGATGNLPTHKLLPALYHLEQAGRLPAQFNVIGFARRNWSDEHWRAEVREILSSRARAGLDDGAFGRFAARLRFFEGDLDDSDAFHRLAGLLVAPEVADDAVFYLAIRPAEFALVSSRLAAAGLNSEASGWHRLVVEKPFGYDLESATPIEQLKPNWVLLNIQPNECLRMELQVKQNGLQMRAETTRLDASGCAIADVPLDAYEALLLDVIEGDHPLFLRYDQVEWAWRVIDPILKVWATERDFIHGYPAGSWGPRECNRLFAREDQYWRNTLDEDCP